MPEGPFGFPRITSMGPFVEKEGEQDFTRTKEEGRPHPNVFTEYLIEQDMLKQDRVIHVKSSLVFREEIDTDQDGILGEIERSMSELGREETVSRCRYWYSPEDSIGMIKNVRTDGDFRSMGIGTKLKELAHEDMRTEGVEIVFTDIISQGGYRLASNTGYMPYKKDDWWRDEQNRGIMHRTL